MESEKHRQLATRQADNLASINPDDYSTPYHDDSSHLTADRIVFDGDVTAP